ncbi:MAG: Arylsulfatase [Schlesneria sp.]|nr:Arylsulfatase [Schlesneria sp.]
MHLYKRHAMKLSVLIMTGLLLTSPAYLLAAEGQKQTRKPNILFIIVDDQSPFDLKAYDSRSTLNTPNIDRLAAEGMVLDRAYQMGSFTGAVCTPSRHMIMCGRTVWHLPIGPTKNKNCPTNLDENTLSRRETT